MTTVCSVDGVEVKENAAGRIIHLDALPKDTPEHEIAPVEALSLTEKREKYHRLRDAAVDMLRHHDSTHPRSGCEFAYRLWEAMRSDLD